MGDEQYPRDEKGKFLPGVHQPNRIVTSEQGREMAAKKWEKWFQNAAEAAWEEVQRMGYDIGPSNLPVHDKVRGIFHSLLTNQLFRHLGNQGLEPSQFRDLERMSHLWLKNMGAHPDQAEAKSARVDITTKGPSQILITGQTMDALNQQMEQIRQRDTVDAEEVQDDSEDADEVDS